MHKVAKAIVDAGDDDEKREALYNTVFARTWRKVQGESTDPLKMMERVEEYIEKDSRYVPDSVMFLTAAVDVQAGGNGKEQRLEVKVVGWGENEEAWIVYRGFIAGNIKSRDTWNKLDQFWEKEWFRQDGKPLRIEMKFVDSGYETQAVYEYTTGRSREGIFSIKGARSYGADLLARKISMVNKGRTPLVVIGTQTAKHEVITRMRDISKGSKAIHFCKAYCDAEYFRQLTAEHAVRKTTGMYEYFVYEKKDRNAANEALDLMVYNYAAMRFYMSRHTWQGLKRRIEVVQNESVEMPVQREQKKESQEVRTPSRPVRSNFVTRW